jgi:deoxycytidylate deaminase
MKPPPTMVDVAVAAANCSPCAKSRRGVVVFRTSGGGLIAGTGHNGPPIGAGSCSADHTCRANCARRCVHAEMRALREADRRGWTTRGLDVLHVKTVDRGLVTSAGPSCVPCANHILDAGIAGVWLYHSQCGCPGIPAIAACPLHYRTPDQALSAADHTTAAQTHYWQRYLAAEFYRLSLAANELPAFAST